MGSTSDGAKKSPSVCRRSSWRRPAASWTSTWRTGTSTCTSTTHLCRSSVKSGLCRPWGSPSRPPSRLRSPLPTSFTVRGWSSNRCQPDDTAAGLD
eukprot:scaffold25009_cov44-Prasinocladus_malaysianus.AAC.1